MDGTHELHLADCGIETCGEDGRSCCEFSREDEEDFNSDDDIQSLNEENQHKDDLSKDSVDSKENITEEVSEELTGEAAEEVIQEDTEEVIEDATEVIEDVIEEPHIDPQEDIVLGDDNSM